MPELISPAAYRILRLLVGTPPQSIAQLTKASGVTRTAVIEQLSELMAQNLVTREVDKGPRRGRPRHLYAATDLALERVFPPSRHLLPSLVQAIDEHGGSELRQDIFQRLGEILAGRYRPKLQGLAPSARLETLVRLMQEEGVLIDVEKHPSGFTLRERTCPFVDLVCPDRAVCEMEGAMFSGLIGWPVKLAQCRLDGCASCVFQLEVPTDGVHSSSEAITVETNMSAQDPAAEPLANVDFAASPIAKENEARTMENRIESQALHATAVHHVKSTSAFPLGTVPQ